MSSLLLLLLLLFSQFHSMMLDCATNSFGGTSEKNCSRRQSLVKANKKFRWLNYLQKLAFLLLITWNGRTINSKHTALERKRNKHSFTHLSSHVPTALPYNSTALEWKPTHKMKTIVLFFVQKCSLFVVEYLRSVFVLWLQYFVAGFVCFFHSVSIHKQFWSNGFGEKKSIMNIHTHTQ